MMDTQYNDSGKRLTALVITGVASVVCGIFWLNNLVSACRYHAALFRGAADAAQNVSAGLWKALAWSTADVSTVSTLIPFLGFLLMFVGLTHVRNREDWPFFAGYDRLNVALGLLGTLWGIILIGYYPAQQVSVAALMSCLHTAMYSTLVAVLWVMVIKPMALMPYLNAVRREIADVPEEDDSLAQTMDSLMQSMGAMSREMQTLTAASGAFQKELAALNSQLKATRETEISRNREIGECLTVMGNLLSGFEEMQKHFAAEREELAHEKNTLYADLQKSHEKLAAASAETGRLNGEVEALESKLTSETEKSQALTREKDALRENLADTQTKLGETAAEKSRLAGEVGALQNKVENAESKNQTLTGEKSALQAELQLTNGKLTDTAADKARLAGEVGTLQTKLANAESSAQALESELNSAKSDNQRLSSKNTSLESDCEKLARQLAAIREALN